MAEHPSPLLEVSGLTTVFHGEEGTARAVDGVGFRLDRGETLGIVGESGCGKSVTALSLLRLLPRPAGEIIAGEVTLEGRDLLREPASVMPRVRGDRISMIFQEPMTALNPVFTVGRQLVETYRLHYTGMSAAEAGERAVRLLGELGIPEPAQRFTEYPHQLSGGMRQRVLIAIALACEPDVLIADEPTTALDVTIQNQILDLMRSMRDEKGTAIIFITHDLGVVAQMCDRVMVMYGGQIMESAPVDQLFHQPRHPYTRGLLSSIPTLDSDPARPLPEIPGMVPDLHRFPEGCRFRNRCAYAAAVCKEPVAVTSAGAGHPVRCARWEETL